MAMDTLFFIAIAILLAYMLARTFVGKVAPDKARALVRDGALLLDVRTPGEFSSGHIQGAKNIPVQELAGRLAELGPRERAIVVYCASGMRSASAASLLRKEGRAEVFDLGSMGRWT